MVRGERRRAGRGRARQSNADARCGGDGGLLARRSFNSSHLLIPICRSKPTLICMEDCCVYLSQSQAQEAQRTASVHKKRLSLPTPEGLPVHLMIFHHHQQLHSHPPHAYAPFPLQIHSPSPASHQPPIPVFPPPPASLSASWLRHRTPLPRTRRLFPLPPGSGRPSVCGGRRYRIRPGE